MPTPVRLVLGLMALWGAVYSFAALGGDFATTPAPGSGHVRPTGLEAVLIHIHAANALAIMLIEGMIALNLGSMKVSQRVTWVFAMMFFYPIAIPAFWYLHIWRRRGKADAAGQSPGSISS